eukprot:6265349-Amphidinium_carterae.8
MQEDYETEWITRGTLPSQHGTDHNDARQANFNFHTTVNEYLNNYWKNDPHEVPAQQEQFEKTCYYMLLVVQTKKRTLEQLGFYLKSNQRKGMWFTRRTYDSMYQINGDGDRRGRVKVTHWEIPKYFMIKCAFKLQKNRPYSSKTKFGYNHFIEQTFNKA